MNRRRFVSGIANAFLAAKLTWSPETKPVVFDSSPEIDWDGFVSDAVSRHCHSIANGIIAIGGLPKQASPELIALHRELNER